MSPNVVPEDFMADSRKPLINLDLKCRQCGENISDSFEWVCIDTQHDDVDEQWDGILVSHIIECPACGAVDDYTVSDRSRLNLLTQLGGPFFKRKKNERVIPYISVLHDGTQIHRPSQGIARLRQIVSENPGHAEAYRYLGNGCERWGLREEAIVAWEKALELDSEEIEAAYSLATHYLCEADDPLRCFIYTRKALANFPKALRQNPDLHYLARPLVDVLQNLLNVIADPVALMAGWSNGEMDEKPVVCMSSSDLRKVENFHLLAEFLVNPDLMVLDLTPDMPEEDDYPTILERLLAGDDSYSMDINNEIAFLPPQPRPAKPRRAPIKIGRNEPCPCGSGKKYKNCCLKSHSG